MRLYIQVFGAKIQAARFERMGSSARSAQTAMRRVGEHVVMPAIEANFQSGGRRGGGSWARDTYAWMLRKMHNDLDMRTGHATWALRDSFTQKDDPNNILRFSNDTVRVGSRLSYAAAFNARRPVLKLTEKDREDMRNVVRDYLLSAWRMP